MSAKQRYREYMRNYMRSYRQRPEVKAQRKAYSQRRDVMDRRNEQQRTPVYRLKQKLRRAGCSREVIAAEVARLQSVLMS